MSESFGFGTPALLDIDDGSVYYVLGTEFESSVNGQVTGVEWYTPGTIAGINHYILFYETTGASTGTFLGSKLITPAAGALQQFAFNSPFSIVASTRYVACVLTRRYTATTSYSWPATTTHLTAPAGVNGRFATTTADDEEFPGTVSGNAAAFHVSPIFVTSGQSAAVTTATETDSAFAFGRSKARPVGLAAETDTAVPLGRAKARTVGTAGSAETALALGRGKSRALGTATETDVASMFARAKARTVGTAGETDIALALDTGLHGPVGGRIVASTRPGRIVSTGRRGRTVRGGGG